MAPLVDGRGLPVLQGHPGPIFPRSPRTCRPSMALEALPMPAKCWGIHGSRHLQDTQPTFMNPRESEGGS